MGVFCPVIPISFEGAKIQKKETDYRIYEKSFVFFASKIELIHNEMNILELSEQEIIRRNSLNELRAMGIDPYPAAEYVTNAFSTDIKAELKMKTSRARFL